MTADLRPAPMPGSQPARQGSADGQPEGPASPRQTTVGVIAGEGVLIGVVLDADAPIAVMIDELVEVVNGRLAELGQPALRPGGRGRWVLCLVDGTALRSSQSLTEQQVYDGRRLWLRFVADPEQRAPVIEHVTTAVATELDKHFPPIDAVTAMRVGTSFVAFGVVAVAALLARWRYGHPGWLSAGCAGLVAVAVFAAAVIIVARARSVPDRQVGDVLLVTGLAPLGVLCAAAVPGPLGAPHAALGFGVAGIAAVLIVRFTGRCLALCTALITVALAVTLVAVVRMLWVTGAVTLLTCLLLVVVLALHGAPALARWMANIRLPVFPSATGRWVFETRPDLPSTVVVAAGGPTTLEGPASVRDVVMRSERARAFLSGLLVGLGVLVVVCGAGLCDPHAPRRWLPVLIVGLVAVVVLLRGRAFADRWQAITMATAAVATVAAVAIRYVVVLWTPVALVVGVAVLLMVPVAGLVAAVVVPRNVYTPLFRKIVEYVEYVCLIPVFPLALWLMNVYAAIRNR
jgi:type VII secretion integral membrane protein EccD